MAAAVFDAVHVVTLLPPVVAGGGGGWRRQVVVLRSDREGGASSTAAAAAAAAADGIDVLEALAWDGDTLAGLPAHCSGAPRVGCALVTREDRSTVWVGGAAVSGSSSGGGWRVVAVLTTATAPAAALRAAVWLAQAASAPTGVLHSRAAALLALPAPPPGYATLLRVGNAPLLAAVSAAVNNMPTAAPDARPLVALLTTLLSAPVIAAAVRALALEVPTLLHVDAAYAPLAPLLAAGLATLLAPLAYQGMFVPSPPRHLPLDDLLQAPVPVFVATTTDRLVELPGSTLRTLAVLDVNADTLTLPGGEVVAASAATVPSATSGAGSRAAALLFSPFRAAAAAVRPAPASLPPVAPPPPWPPAIATPLLSSLTLYGDRLYRGPAARAAALAALTSLPPAAAGAYDDAVPAAGWPGVCPREHDGDARPYLVAIRTTGADAAPSLPQEHLVGRPAPPQLPPPSPLPAAARGLASPPPVRATRPGGVVPKATPQRRGRGGLLLSPTTTSGPAGGTTRAGTATLDATAAPLPAAALLAGGDGDGSGAAAAVECVRKACMEAMAALFGDYDAYFVDLDPATTTPAAGAPAGAEAAYIGLRFDTAAAVVATPDRQPLHAALLATQAFAEFLAQRLRWTAVTDAECLYFDALADAVAHRGSSRCDFLTNPALAPPARNNALAFQWQPPPPSGSAADDGADDDDDDDPAAIPFVAYMPAFRRAARGDVTAGAPNPRRRVGTTARRSMFGVAAAGDGGGDGGGDGSSGGAPVRLSLAAPAQWSVRVHRLSMLPPPGAHPRDGGGSPPAAGPGSPLAGTKRRAAAPLSPPHAATTCSLGGSPGCGGAAPASAPAAHARSVRGLASGGRRRALLQPPRPPAPPPPPPAAHAEASETMEVARLHDALARSERDRRRWAADVAATYRSMRVLVRVRPPPPGSGAADGGAALQVHAATVALARGGGGSGGSGGWQTWEFDGVIGADGSQGDVYSHLEPTVLRCVTAGENGLLLAYGQTGSGKTHTMAGAGGWGDSDAVGAGIVGRALATLYAALADGPPTTVRMSLVEVYNEELVDLLAPDLPHTDGCDCGAARCGTSTGGGGGGGRIAIRTVGGGGGGGGARGGGAQPPRVVLAGIAAPVVATHAAAAALLAAGAARRATASNGINAVSSRSHLLAFLYLYRQLPHGGPIVESKLVLGDLAGSERLAAAAAAAAMSAAAAGSAPTLGAVDGGVTVSDLSGARWKESTAINLSLTTLGRVMAGRSAEGSGGEAGHLPYRDSVLTHALSDCLGGNARAALVCTLSSAAGDAGETAATLAFAARARSIQCTPLAGLRVTPGAGASASRRGSMAPAAAGGGADTALGAAAARALQQEVSSLRMELARRDVRIAALEAALAASTAAAPDAVPAPPPVVTLRSRQAAAAARLAQPKAVASGGGGSDVLPAGAATGSSDENVLLTAATAAGLLGGEGGGCSTPAGLRSRPASQLALHATPHTDSSSCVPRSVAPTRDHRRRVSFMPGIAPAAAPAVAATASGDRR